VEASFFSLSLKGEGRGEGRTGSLKRISPHPLPEGEGTFCARICLELYLASGIELSLQYWPLAVLRKANRSNAIPSHCLVLAPAPSPRGWGKLAKHVSIIMGKRSVSGENAWRSAGRCVFADSPKAPGQASRKTRAPRGGKRRAGGAEDGEIAGEQCRWAGKRET
jgi:hypothetical protein